MESVYFAVFWYNRKIKTEKVVEENTEKLNPLHKLTETHTFETGNCQIRSKLIQFMTVN